jgi:RHH-type proline utilization regulon transcriptional repressor/proline dehydrogenase/delta 1-pyrroline-5-carboxylate dehydrogenase
MNSRNDGAAILKPFRAPYAPPDEPLVAILLPKAQQRPAAAEARIDARATRFVKAIRARAGGVGGIEDFLHEYSLSTKEGLALMVLAEALLRVPDDATADRLIEDKLSAADFSHHEPRSDALLIAASAWALGLSTRIVAAGETPESILSSVVKRLGLTAVRSATRQAVRLLGSHFVLGQSVGEALSRARTHGEFLYSFDMLGEGARTAADAERYFLSYRDAIESIGRYAGNQALPGRPGISVKLSALHPRFEAVSRTRVLSEIVPKITGLAQAAKAYDLNFTVDAEEADRLELSLDVFARVASDPTLAGWRGFGLAVQAYQKRALAVIDWLTELAQDIDQTFMVRLVKGAYWDTEVKRAQECGLTDYPVFTRKAVTDLNYISAMRKLLAARPRLYPQFATHNALTVATVIEEAGGVAGYEFQRLHGMGDALYEALLADEPNAICRVYAPVGGHRDLLAYLVRRLLENGANSSFVSVAADPNIPIEKILERPQRLIGEARNARNPAIPLPKDLLLPVRGNSQGIEFGDGTALEALLAEIHGAERRSHAASIIDGMAQPGPGRDLISPIDGRTIGFVVDGNSTAANAAMLAAQIGFPDWSARTVDERAQALDHAADIIEKNRGGLIALLQSEGGKTLDDALAEVREAADFCRYYAAEARRVLMPELLPGPTGEVNELRYRGRGVFVCISPWNFPLAIFVGQIAAGLAAGNTIVAKPAEQTPLIAAEAVALLHAAGVPESALHLVTGDGSAGAALVGNGGVAGVAFTGSVEVARSINRALAAKDSAIVPFIAETGGVNAMIVDATALPEQATDDVITSAFRSAGQRCSALRLLCVQEDVADRIIEMIAGAASELKVGDPRKPSVHIGPVIDLEAKKKLDAWIAKTELEGRVQFRWDQGHPLPTNGTFVTPTIINLDRASDLKEEVFGPVLHVVRYPAGALDALLDDIAESGYGLTLGIHSRIDATVDRIVTRLAVGNVYVNRSTIGAVVGSQPFGGTSLSGTGPKAGGPNYLRRFALEQTVSTNVSAVGGDAILLTKQA